MFRAETMAPTVPFCAYLASIRATGWPQYRGVDCKLDEKPGKTRKRQGGRGEPTSLAAAPSATVPTTIPASDESSGPSQSDPEHSFGAVSASTETQWAASEEEPPANPLATTWTELDLRCPHCNIIHYVPICLFLNEAESPHLGERLRRRQFNRKRCPMCRRIELVEHPYTYFDPSRQLAVQVRPEWEWKAGGGEEWYAARLEDFFEQWKDHEVRIDVVFGEDQLIEKYLDVGDSPEQSP